MGSLRLASLFVACLLGAACTMITGRVDPGPLPRDGAVCADVYSPNRCDLIRNAAAEQLGVDLGELTDLRIMPDPNSFDANGNRVLVTYGGGTPMYVRVSRIGAPTQNLMLGCAGVDTRPFCTDEPRLRAEQFIGSGYRDTPCAGEPPDGCATPVPAPDAAARALAQPLKIDRVAIPIDHEGDYKVKLGAATLPNGWLETAEYLLVDEWPKGVTILDGTVRMSIESLEPDGKPFDNVYAHGRRKGVERIAVYLVFRVDRFEPGAVLSVKDVLVS